MSCSWVFHCYDQHFGERNSGSVRGKLTNAGGLLQDLSWNKERQWKLFQCLAKPAWSSWASAIKYVHCIDTSALLQKKNSLLLWGTIFISPVIHWSCLFCLLHPRFTNALTYMGLLMLSTTMSGDRYLNLFLSAVMDLTAGVISVPIILKWVIVRGSR